MIRAFAEELAAAVAIGAFVAAVFVWAIVLSGAA
jgi:hypothetical protein